MNNNEKKRKLHGKQSSTRMGGKAVLASLKENKLAGYFSGTTAQVDSKHIQHKDNGEKCAQFSKLLHHFY